jgi:hypothetical protein
MPTPLGFLGKVAPGGGALAASRIGGRGGDGLRLGRSLALQGARYLVPVWPSVWITRAVYSLVLVAIVLAPAGCTPVPRGAPVENPWTTPLAESP